MEHDPVGLPRADNAPVEREPTDIHWTLADVAPCGSVVFNRPCQIAGLGIDADAAPLANGCKTRSEIVFVVEDERDLREGLVELLQAHGREVIGCADAQEFDRASKAATSGCVILDIRLKGSDGLAILERMKDQKSTLAFVVLSGLSDPVIAARCVQEGACEYLAKPVQEIALLRTVERAIGNSRIAFCRKQSRNLIERLFSRLTPAERTVAEMLSKGYPTKTIAGTLGRSENTIKIHRHRILSKLKVSSPASIANMHNYLRDTE